MKLSCKGKGECKMNGLAGFHIELGLGKMMMSGWHGTMEQGSGKPMTSGSVGLKNKYFCLLTYLPFHLEMVYVPWDK